MRPDETWHRLLEWTYGQTPSERLAAQILLASGFKEIDPIHPLGGRDGGKDALCRKDGALWVMAVYFPRGKKEIKDITHKFKGDLTGAEKNKAIGIAFVTNQELTDGERKSLVTLGDGRFPKIAVDLFHLERVVTLLDSPPLASVRQQYLDIRPLSITNSHDQKLFNEFLATLPSESDGIYLLKSHDLGASFQSDWLNALDTFNHSWRNAEHEFIDEEVENQKIKFLGALSAFIKKICCHTHPSYASGYLNIGMNDFETRQEMFELQKKLNDLATAAFTEHQSLVRIGRRRIA